MKLREIFKTRIVVALSVLCILTMSNQYGYAGIQDSTISSTTAVIDTATKNSTVGLSQASAPLISTAVDTVARYLSLQQIPAAKDYSESYKSASYYVLLFFLVCIFIAVIGKILKVYEISRELQGLKSKYNARRIQGVLFIVFLLFGLFGVYWTYTVQGAMSIHESASEHGLNIDFMFKITLVLTTVVFILTHFALFGFSFKYRATEKRKAYFYPHNNALERIWTIIPGLVLTVLVVLGFFTWRDITNVSIEDQNKAINIEVTGEQFKWSLRYAGSDNKIGNHNYKLTTPTNGLGIDFKDQKSWDDKLVGEIVLPVNKAVHVSINSKDVLHSFYLPDFRVQTNAVPGLPTSFQFTPRLTTAQMREKRNDPAYDYVLLCAKVCGAGHYNMQAKVTVVTDAEYATWLAKQPLYYNDDVKRELQLQMVNSKDKGDNDKMALNTNTIIK